MYIQATRHKHTAPISNRLPPRLMLLSPPPPNRIHHPPTHQLRHTKPHRRPPYNSPRAPFTNKRLLPPPRQQQIQSRPSGAQSRTVDLVIVDVEVGAEEENGREHQGEEPRRSRMLGGHESCEYGGRDG